MTHKRSYQLIALILLASSALIGCGTGTQTSSSSSSNNSGSPSASLSGSSLSFGNEALNSTSVSQSLTVTNTGSKALSITSVGISGDFSQSNNCANGVAANGSCTINVTFTPTALGSRTGVLSISDNAADSPHQVNLSGTGVSANTPLVSFTPTQLTFSSQVLSTTSSPGIVTVTNTGSASVTFTSVTATGDFTETNNCGTTLAAGSSCTISVVFTPSSVGARTGIVAISDNAAGSPQQVTLSGTGVSAATPVVSVTPAQLTFGSQVLNTSSSSGTITVANTGSASVTFTSITTTGDFAETNNCGTTLKAGSSCAINVVFSPSAVGARTGTVAISDNASGSPQQIALSGTGVSVAAPIASITPLQVTFSSQVVNTTSSPGVVTLTNSGSASLTLTSISVTGDFAQTNSCGKTLAAGSSCTVSVTFTPSSVGSRAGTLTFSDNASPSTQTVTLSGTSVTAGHLVASPASIAFGSVTVGQLSSQSVTISNTGGQTVSISSDSTSGPGFGMSGISTPLSIGANQSSTFQVTFNPSSTGAASGTIYLVNTGDTPNLTIPVTGTGTAAPSHQVVLAWAASSSQVLGYYLYRGTVTGGPYSKLTSSVLSQTSYTDKNVTAGSSYFYVVTSVATDLVESSFSNEAEATVPTP